jgi:ligand-binding sensor domain-containing protein
LNTVIIREIQQVSVRVLSGHLLVDRQGNLWVGTSGGGLNRYVAEFDYFERYIHRKEDPASLSHNDVLYLYQDKDDVIVGIY